MARVTLGAMGVVAVSSLVAASTFTSASAQEGGLAKLPELPPEAGFEPVPEEGPPSWWQGDPGEAPLREQVERRAMPGAEARSSSGCWDAPPQNYSIYPLRGCALVPPSSGWANEMCLGGNGAYDCREIIGHPDLNIYPTLNATVYKSSYLKAAHTDTYGMEIVMKDGRIFEGCTRWMGWSAGVPRQL